LVMWRANEACFDTFGALNVLIQKNINIEK